MSCGQHLFSYTAALRYTAWDQGVAQLATHKTVVDHHSISEFIPFFD